MSYNFECQLTYNAELHTVLIQNCRHFEKFMYLESKKELLATSSEGSSLYFISLMVTVYSRYLNN